MILIVFFYYTVAPLFYTYMHSFNALKARRHFIYLYIVLFHITFRQRSFTWPDYFPRKRRVRWHLIALSLESLCWQTLASVGQVPCSANPRLPLLCTHRTMRQDMSCLAMKIIWRRERVRMLPRPNDWRAKGNVTYTMTVFVHSVTDALVPSGVNNKCDLNTDMWRSK